MPLLISYFSRLFITNPIFLRVVETGGRRKRDLVIRCGYLGLLILVVLISLYSSSIANASLAELAKASANVFQRLSYLQLGLVALLAPMFTAGAITQEKDSQTYDILLSTPLTNGQILLGSLLSRLFFIIILLISGIPIFSITQIFGGVAIHNILVSFLIAAATAFVTGSLAMAIATFKVGTRKTIFGFYLFILTYLVGLFLLDQANWFHPILKYDADPADPRHLIPVFASTSWLTALHPFLALRTLFVDRDYTPPDLGSLPPDLQHWPFSWYLCSPASFYITIMLVLSMVMILPSIILLRRLAQSNVSIKTWILTRLHLSTGDRNRKPRTVWTNPIAWREAKTKASPARASLLRYGFILVGILAAIILAYQFSTLEETPYFIRPDSFNNSTSILTVYSKETAHRYVYVPNTTQITFKRFPTDQDTRPGSLSDLRYHYAISVEANPDNTLALITIMPIPHKVREDNVRNYLLGFVVLEFAVILLIVTNAAASTVTREKEDGTLDLLLTTPITSRYYIWGKLRGLVIFVLPLIAVPVASVLVFVVFDLLRFASDASADRWIAFPESLILIPGILIIVAAFAAILGMRFSLSMRTSVAAVMTSLGIVASACSVLGYCGYSVLDYHQAGTPSLVAGSFSPFTVMTMLINPYQFAATSFDDTDQAGNRVVIFISTMAAIGCYSLIVWSMYRGMVKNFDMTIRRQQR